MARSARRRCRRRYPPARLPTKGHDSLLTRSDAPYIVSVTDTLTHRGLPAAEGENQQQRAPARCIPAEARKSAALSQQRAASVAPAHRPGVLRSGVADLCSACTHHHQRGKPPAGVADRVLPLAASQEAAFSRSQAAAPRVSRRL